MWFKHNCNYLSWCSSADYMCILKMPLKTSYTSFAFYHQAPFRHNPAQSLTGPPGAHARVPRPPALTGWWLPAICIGLCIGYWWCIQTPQSCGRGDHGYLGRLQHGKDPMNFDNRLICLQSRCTALHYSGDRKSREHFCIYSKIGHSAFLEFSDIVVCDPWKQICRKWRLFMSCLEIFHCVVRLKDNLVDPHLYG